VTLFRRILTYRLTYYLAALVLAEVALAWFGIVRPLPLNLAFSLVVALASCFAANEIFARVFGAKSNWESVSISAMILTLIVTPAAPMDFTATGFLVFCCAWAMASKYILATSKKHIFNPAAFGVALGGLLLKGSVSWWVGDNSTILPLIVLGGILVLTRLHYYELVISFAVVVLGLTLVNNPIARAGTALTNMTVHSAFCFFLFVMLTEPRTVPLGRWRQIAYGALVGLLFAPDTHVGDYYFTPEVALLIGNIFTFLSNRRRLQRWTAVLGIKDRLSLDKAGAKPG
jgi:Na+-transporting NADH:ubiquinone oxidoreductase subunit NqrB